MAKPKDTHIPMNETKIQKLKMTPNFIIRFNPSTTLLEMNVEVLNDKFSTQEDEENHAPI